MYNLFKVDAVKRIRESLSLVARIVVGVKDVYSGHLRVPLQNWYQ